MNDCNFWPKSRCHHSISSSCFFSSLSLFSLIYSAFSLIFAGKLKLSMSTISSWATLVALISSVLNFSCCFLNSYCFTSSFLCFGIGTSMSFISFCTFCCEAWSWPRRSLGSGSEAPVVVGFAAESGFKNCDFSSSGTARITRRSPTRLRELMACFRDLRPETAVNLL